MSYIGNAPAVVPVERQISGVSVGTIVTFPYGRPVPAGYLKSDGHRFSKTTYPDLFNYLGSEYTPNIEGESRIGDVVWFPKRAHIHADFVPADGQLLNISDYPDVQTAILGDKIHKTTDANFSNDVKYRGFWMTDLPDVFRVPDMNGKTLNSAGSVFIRGDGDRSNGSALIQDCMIQSHNHGLGASAYALWYDSIPSSGDRMFLTPVTSGSRWFTTIPATGKIEVQQSGGNETRPTNLAGCWAVRVKRSVEYYIKAAGFIENEGLAKVGGLIETDSRLQKEIDNIKEKPIITLIGNEEFKTSVANEAFSPKFAVATIDDGFNYDKSAGSITIPKSGVYRIQYSLTLQAGSTDTSNATGGIYINSTSIYYTLWANYYSARVGSSTIATSSGELFLRLSKGDKVFFEVRAINDTSIRLWSPGQFNCEFIKE